MSLKVYLIGMPGSGKTTLGRELAGRLGVPFIDLDDAIVASEGDSIPGIFEKKGELHFRTAESAMLRRAATTADSFVMATGGGAPCHFEGVERMLDSGLTVFLDIPTSTLARRILAEGTASRPMFAGHAEGEIQRVLERLRSERLPFYSRAHVIVGEGTTAEELQRWILLRKESPR
jgi:shikimate kinase